MIPSEAKRIRKESGLSQSDMARVLRIKDDRTIRRWETGERPVSGPASILMELMDAGQWTPGKSGKAVSGSVVGEGWADLFSVPEMERVRIRYSDGFESEGYFYSDEGGSVCVDLLMEDRYKDYPSHWMRQG